MHEITNEFYLILAILAASFGTMLTRFLPFWLLRNYNNNKYLKYLQNTMPLLIMTLLVFFSIKDVKWNITYGIPELIGIFISVIFFIRFKNPILSILAGIVFYILATMIFL